MRPQLQHRLSSSPPRRVFADSSSPVIYTLSPHISQKILAIHTMYPIAVGFKLRRETVAKSITENPENHNKNI